MNPLVRVRVPATSANLGAGFDALGLALSLYNVYELLEVLPEGGHRIEVVGEGSDELVDPAKNLVVHAYEEACREWKMEPKGLSLRALNIVPLASGLGSSAGAVVGGVLLANALREHPLSREELLPLMVRIEGHPDNVVPCCVGGMTVSAWDGTSLRHLRLEDASSDPTIVVAVPNVRLFTSEARAALPESVPLGDAAFNVGRAALFVAAWATGVWEMLSWAMEDRLHQPFRLKLFPGGEPVIREVRNCPECLGAAISGSGPSILAFVRGEPRCVAERMCRVFAEHGVRSRFFVLDIDRCGATTERRAI